MTRAYPSTRKVRHITMPRNIVPMLALSVPDLPADGRAYHYEYKWDGVRAIAYWNGNRLRLSSRNGKDMTHRYPELHAAAAKLGRRPMVLDGEIIAVDAHGQPSFPLLQRRMHVQDPQAIARLVNSVPVAYLVFDLLYLDGTSIMPLPLTVRRGLLEKLTLSGPMRLSPAVVGEGGILLRSARELRLEGVVAKHSESIYEPGQRSGAWLKIKLIARQEFVIGGWIAEHGENRARVGALLLGVHAGDDGLRYVGKVGSGFDQQWHRRLTRQLKRREKKTNPFGERVPTSGVHFVRPDLVAEIEYRRWPSGAQLQQAAFKGLRDDKLAEQVVDERAR